MLVIKLVKSYCVLDLMLMILFFDCFDEVLLIIIYFVNFFLVCGYFLMDWKEVLVKLFLKKFGFEV